jgi:hypothetical protein
VVESPWLVIIMPLCFLRANTLDEERAIARRLNEAAFEHAIYDPLGLYLQPGFHRFLVAFSLMRDLLFQKPQRISDGRRQRLAPPTASTTSMVRCVWTKRLP